MKKKLLASLLCMAMASSLLIGCGGSSDSEKEGSSATEEASGTQESTDASSKNSTGEAADASEVTVPEEKGDWVVGFSNYSAGNSWRQQMEAEFKEEAEALKKAGVISDYTMLNADNDQSKQISDIRDLITMGCDAIVVTAITADGLNDVLEEAEEEGIKVVNCDNLSSSTKLTSKVMVSDYDFGKLCGEWLGEQLPDGGKVIELNGTAGTSTDTNRAAGMEDGLAEASPDSEIIASVNADWDYATAKTAVEELLNTYPEIDGVLSQGGAMTQAAMEAFEAAGRKLVPMTGEASNGFLRSWVEAKDKGFSSIAFVCPTTQSAIALDVAVNALNGEEVQPEYLASEDPVTIDGGNSHFPDTQRRTEYVESQGKYYVGCGVSGGESGALRGPSLMPGGSKEAWPKIQPILQAIAAKTEDGIPCCQWVGNGGAGHFVKMVHNGIEYGDMELICEAYHLMKTLLGLSCQEMYEIFARWNESRLNSYLIEITGDILAYRDEDGEPLVEHILDTAGQKGTGKWTVEAALNQGSALTLIGEAVFSRCLSAMKEERVKASRLLPGVHRKFEGNKEEFLNWIEDALYASKIVSYAQGYALMRNASVSYGWKLAYGDIALMWRGGCIIRSAFLGEIKNAYDKNPALENLLLDSYFTDAMEKAQQGWRKVCAAALEYGVPVPAMTSALSYYDGCRCERLPANLLQAQRDYFGAHTYERLDAPRGQFFHTNWTGEGNGTAASVYSV